MLADTHVVPDLDLVVELDAIFNDGVLDRTAVNRGVCADLNVIAQAHPTDLWHLDPAPFIAGKPESIGAYHAAGL